jgi:Zn-dependent membrane protease YugP
MKISNKANMTGKDLAFISKQNLELNNLDFALTKDKLGDAYSPKYNTLILSEEVCNTASLSSLTIVAHELGHACQHKNSTPLFFITQLFTKITNFTNKFIMPLLIIGLFLFVFKYPNDSLGLILMGVSAGLFIIHLLNQILTIPLEYDASRRALKYLKEYQFVSPAEYRKAKKLLNIAAQTYIAGLLDGILILNKKKRKKK